MKVDHLAVHFNYIFFNVLFFINCFVALGKSNPIPAGGFKKLSKGITKYTPLESKKNSFVLDIEHILGNADNSEQEQVPLLSRKLDELNKLILQVTEKYHNEKPILYAFDILVKLKKRQIEAEANNLKSITKHIDQMLEALRLMAFTHWDEANTDLKIMTVGEESSPKVRNTGMKGDAHPQLKKILSTGGFIFLIFATASDTCVMTGGAFCVLVYLAGVGGIVIWLESIYKAALSIK